MIPHRLIVNHSAFCQIFLLILSRLDSFVCTASCWKQLDTCLNLKMLWDLLPRLFLFYLFPRVTFTCGRSGSAVDPVSAVLVKLFLALRLALHSLRTVPVLILSSISSLYDLAVVLNVLVTLFPSTATCHTFPFYCDMSHFSLLLRQTIALLALAQKGVHT